MLYFSKNQYTFPPTISSCPDYWVIQNDSGNYTCNDKAQIYGTNNNYKIPGDTTDNGLLKTSLLTQDDICELRNQLRSSGILWTGITNNEKLCGFEDID